MRYKTITILILFLFPAFALSQIRDFLNGEIINHIDFGIPKIYMVSLDDCAEISVYFLCRKTGNCNITFENIKDSLIKTYRDPPYSLYTLESFLIKLGYKAISIRLKQKNYISSLKQDYFILYIPPDKYEEIGHFVYTMRNKNNNLLYTYEYDGKSLKRNPLLKSPLYKKWEGVLIALK